MADHGMGDTDLLRSLHGARSRNTNRRKGDPRKGSTGGPAMAFKLVHVAKPGAYHVMLPGIDEGGDFPQIAADARGDAIVDGAAVAREDVPDKLGAFGSIFRAICCGIE